MVVPYPGLDPNALPKLAKRVEAFGMRLNVIERKLPHLKIVHNLEGRDAQIEDIKTLLRNMAQAGLEILCYNWMPDEDWQRTSKDVPERGGAKVTAFDLSQIAKENPTDADGLPPTRTPADRLWDNLKRFLDEILPTAEDCKVRLALHPDDPPLANLRGQDRIITGNEAFERVVNLAPSPYNGLCYCQGPWLRPGWRWKKASENWLLTFITLTSGAFRARRIISAKPFTTTETSTWRL